MESSIPAHLHHVKKFGTLKAHIYHPMQCEGVHEKTVLLVKPDAVQRGLIGEIIHRLEMKGMKVIGCKMMRLDEVLLREHYAHHVNKSFYAGLEKFMMSSPIVALCVEGAEVVETVRLLLGVTKSRQAAPGSIRGDLAMGVACNVAHASDSVENAQSEVARFFKEGELFDYDKTEYLHVYSEDERA